MRSTIFSQLKIGITHISCYNLRELFVHVYWFFFRCLCQNVSSSFSALFFCVRKYLNLCKVPIVMVDHDKHNRFFFSTLDGSTHMRWTEQWEKKKNSNKWIYHNRNILCCHRVVILCYFLFHFHHLYFIFAHEWAMCSVHKRLCASDSNIRCTLNHTFVWKCCGEIFAHIYEIYT